MRNLLPDNPPGHRIDVEPVHIAPQAVGFQQGRPTSHERVRHHPAAQVVGRIELFGHWSFAEFCQEKRPEQSPRPPRKPLVDSDDGAIVLLNLLLPKCQPGYKRHIKARFNGARGD